jgi:hypothetical protein
VSEVDVPFEISRCDACQLRYLPTDGPCPKCGARKALALPVPALGTVLVATELLYPASGWTAPHRLALVEVAESVRLLAIVEGALPSSGDVVAVRKDGDVYRVRAEPSAGGRGEGESPKAGPSAPSFEPPR